MLKKIAAVAAISLAATLSAVPAHAATTRASYCGWQLFGSESFYYINCTSQTVAVHYGFGINPALDNCTTVSPWSMEYIEDRATFHYVTDGACK